MNPIFRLLLLGLLPTVLAPRGGAGEAGKAAGTAVVELFTSQGCSSCPSADRLLTKLAHDPRYQGKVIPLSFHVDYWNYIGWTDPYSSARWSDRQRRYARAFQSSRIYTPQVVVNGRSECVGSQEGEVRERIDAALAAEPAGQVSLAIDSPTPDGHLKVRVGAKLARPAGSAKSLDLWVAVYQSGLATEVKAGENASRLLKNDRVVRRFEKAFTLPAAAGAEKSGEVILGLDKRWKTTDLGVAAFLQDPATLAIHGAAERDLER